MQLHELPHFVIDAVEVAEAGRSLRGRFTSMVGVREGRSWLYDRDESLIGDLESLEPSTGRAAFVAPYWTSASRARPGASMPWVDGYWQAYHLTMILDSANVWRRTTFTPSAAQYFLVQGHRGWQPTGQQLPEGATPLEVVEGAWDHEHCELCKATIGVHGAPVGYRDDSNRWLCEPCFQRYAAPRDLAFLLE